MKLKSKLKGLRRNLEHENLSKKKHTSQKYCKYNFALSQNYSKPPFVNQLEHIILQCKHVLLNYSVSPINRTN